MTPPLKARLADLRALLCTVAVVLILRTVVFEPFTIPSASMEPGLLVGDYLVASKFAYGWSRYALPFSPPLFHGRLFGKDPKRGDVVVFRLPRDPRITYVKRVIGLPGDTVQVLDGAVIVNGAPLPRTRLGPAYDPDAPGEAVQAVREAGRVTFDRGPGHEGDDTGVYRVPSGSYFVLGDNRDNSLDSRWPASVGVGFVPAENLVGRAAFVLASWRPGVSLLRPWTWATQLRWDRFLRPI